MVGVAVSCRGLGWHLMLATCEHTKKNLLGQSPVKSAKGLQWLCWLLVSLVAEAAGVPSAGKVTGNPRNSCCMADSLSSLLLVVTSLSSAGLCWDETEAGLSCGPWKAGEASGSPYSLSPGQGNPL